MQIAAPFLLAFAASVGLVPICRIVALRLGFVAQPREDRWHRREIALLGGVAIGASLFVSTLVYGDFRQSGAIVAGAAIMFVLGLADDILTLKPSTKLIAQICAASLLPAVRLPAELGRVASPSTGC